MFVKSVAGEYAQEFTVLQKYQYCLMFNILSCAIFFNASHVYAIILADYYPSIRNPAETQCTDLSNANKFGPRPQLITKTLLCCNSRS